LLDRKRTPIKTSTSEFTQYPAKNTAINSFRTKTGIPVLTLLLHPEGGYPHYCYSNIEYTPSLNRKQTLIKTPTPESAQYPAKNTAINYFLKKQVFQFLPLLLQPEGGYPHYCYFNIEYNPFLDRKRNPHQNSNP